MLQPAEHADNKGFTLIELMIAIFIMAIGLLALLQTVNLAIAHNNSNKLREDAIIYADQAIGKARTKAFDSVFTNTTTPVHKSGLGTVKYAVYSKVSSITGHSLKPAPAGDGIAGIDPQ